MSYGLLPTGFGGASSIPFLRTDGVRTRYVQIIDLLNSDLSGQDIKDFNPTVFATVQSKIKVNTKYIVIWIAKGWQPSWFSLPSIQELIDDGYVPVFMYWYFGDNMDAMPTPTEISEYNTDSQDVSDMLNVLSGEFWFIYEPEFNKSLVEDSIPNQVTFAGIFRDSMNILKSTFTTQPVKYSLCMMDTGRRDVDNISCTEYGNCALGDVSSWDNVTTIFNELSGDIDFISFSEMIAQFSRDPINPSVPVKYSDSEIGVDYLDRRIKNMVNYLSNTYNKEVFIPYIMIASGTWEDVNSSSTIEDNEVTYDGWASKVTNLYRGLHDLGPILLDYNCLGYCTMELFDNPVQDLGGYQYFMNNEYHYGLVGSSALDESGPSTGDIRIKDAGTLEYLFKIREEVIMEIIDSSSRGEVLVQNQEYSFTPTEDSLVQNLGDVNMEYQYGTALPLGWAKLRIEDYITVPTGVLINFRSTTGIGKITVVPKVVV